MEQRIAIIGVEAVRSALAATVTGGYRVRLGIRPGSEPSSALGRSAGRAKATSVREAVAWAEVAFLAVPSPAAVEAATAAGTRGPCGLHQPARLGQRPGSSPPVEGSVSAARAAALPDAKVVKAFSTFGAEIHGDPSVGGRRADVLIASDHGRAAETVGEIASRAGFTPIPAGGLRGDPDWQRGVWWGLCDVLAGAGAVLPRVGGVGWGRLDAEREELSRGRAGPYAGAAAEGWPSG